jgi:glycosyltransferase involved in cell wall biosynthesis
MIAKLKKKALKKNISITRFQPSFDDNDYIKLIDDADILLLPYKFKLYQNRGSGVIADGVLAGKIFIYTQGVGMESFLKFGNGLPANSSANFAINIMKIILNLESFNQKTLVARDEYIRSLNETKLYLKRLL